MGLKLCVVKVFYTLQLPPWLGSGDCPRCAEAITVRERGCVVPLHPPPELCAAQEGSMPEMH